MSMDYSQFRDYKGMAIPNAMRVAMYNKGRVELLSGIHEHYGYNSILTYPEAVQPMLREIKSIHEAGDQVYVGVEVELENYRAIAKADSVDSWYYSFFWLDKDDGSLRNAGREFVSRFGLLAQHTHLALPALEKYVTTVTGGKVEANARTGLHVHLDVTALDCYQLSNLLFIYSVLEPAIFRMSGGRDENIFCVPWETNRQTLGDVVSHLLSKTHHAMNPWRWRNYSKYCGLNLASISTYGTIEFRMHKGTYKAHEIKDWVDFITRLYRYARDSDFVDNVTWFRENRADYKYWDLMYRIMPTYSEELAKLQHCNREELLIRCKYATINFLKHFVDPSQLPDSSIITAPMKKYIPRDLEAIDEMMREARFNIGGFQIEVDDEDRFGGWEPDEERA